MKYAFIFGTSAFIVPDGVISYADHERTKEILRIRSIYHDDRPASFLSIDLDIKDIKGNPVKLTANEAAPGTGHIIKEEKNSVTVINEDGSVVIHVHQIDDRSAMKLELNITGELEVNAPVAVIRVSGNFMTENLHILGEDEKLFINSNGYATLALAGDSLRFTADGVLL